MFAVLFTLISLVSTVAGAADYHPEVLRGLGARVARVADSGATPVVVFDLDDTLIDSRVRTTRILRELAHDDQILTTFTNDAERLAQVTPSRVRFSMDRTFAVLRIENEDLLARANDYWRSHFFTSEYCARDKPLPGAVGYLNWLARRGARIVYLTGRDAPNMEAGTRYNLTRSRFPMMPGQAVLIMKPDARMDDTEFKKTAFDSISSLGTVVGVFENEPRNINVLHDAFPHATAVFVDSIHSPRPDRPDQDASWIRDFRRR